MHTLGTVPHLLISDQTYLFNTCLVLILLFERRFFQSTLAALASTANFSAFAVHRRFSTSSCLQTRILFHLLGIVSLFFYRSHLLYLPFYFFLSILTNSHYFRLCLLYFIAPFIL